MGRAAFSVSSERHGHERVGEHNCPSFKTAVERLEVIRIFTCYVLCSRCVDLLVQTMSTGKVDTMFVVPNNT